MLRVMRKKVINRRKNHHLRRSQKSRKNQKNPKTLKNQKNQKNPKNPKNILKSNQSKTMKILLTKTKVKVHKTSEQS